MFFVQNKFSNMFYLFFPLGVVRDEHVDHGGAIGLLERLLERRLYFRLRLTDDASAAERLAHFLVMAFRSQRSHGNAKRKMKS